MSKENYKTKTKTTSFNYRDMFWYFSACVLFIILMFLLKTIFRESFNQPALINNYFKKNVTTVPKIRGDSKGEILCKQAVEKIFGKPFIKIRPEFLKNNVTNKNLELDMYNEDLKLAVEYQGHQHKKYVPFFHKNYEHFLTQKYRDEIKKMLCKQHGICLIEVFHDEPLDQVEHIIRVRARENGYKV